MSDVLRLSWSVARSGWLATWNRTFRFSRMKSGMVMLALQAIFFVLVVRKAPAAGGTAGLPGALSLMSLQMAWFGLMYGFSRGQFQLYQGILVPLFQVTPARPLSFLLGRALEAVPSRAWSCLLWGYAYSAMVPGNGRWSAMLLLTAAGLLAGVTAHLSGLLLLAFWSRTSPRTMRTGLMLFGASSLAMATWAMIFLAQGGTLTAVAAAMRQYRQVVVTAVVLLGGLPGLLLLAAAMLRPRTVEELYRQGLYRVLEMKEQDVKGPGRSRWLPIASPVLRAVLSREWLELGRSPVARIQLMIWAAGTVGVFYAGRAAAGQPMAQVIRYVGVLSLLSWFMAYGHWVVRVFEKERRTLLLYRLAAVRTAWLLLAKFLSIFLPSAVLLLLSILVGCLSAELSLQETMALTGWSLGALAAGVTGGFGMAAATAGEEPEEQAAEGAGAGEGDSVQATGSAWWSVARVAALIVTAAVPIWAGAGQPGLPDPLPVWLMILLSAALSLGLLVWGVRLMLRSWERTG